jgi:hypothetical protein
MMVECVLCKKTTTSNPSGICDRCIVEGHRDWNAVTKPKHYNSHPSGIQQIEITRHMGFNLGNAIKYIWRADLKGNAIEDLEKARWYLDDEIAKRKGIKRET